MYFNVEYFVKVNFFAKYIVLFTVMAFCSL